MSVIWSCSVLLFLYLSLNETINLQVQAISIQITQKKHLYPYLIESYHRQLRKVTKSKSVFPTDDALLKMLYLATMDVTRKWTTRVKNWAIIDRVKILWVFKK